MARVVDVLLKAEPYWETGFILALIIGFTWWAVRRLRVDERLLDRRLAGAGWRVNHGGSSLIRAGLRLRFARPPETWLEWRRPLAVKAMPHLTAWLCGCLPTNVRILCVRSDFSEYPHLTLERRISLSPRQVRRLSDPYLADRFPELCQAWVVKCWGDNRRAAEFLSRIAEAVRESVGIAAIETKDEHFFIMSRKHYHKFSGESGLLRFAAQAMPILEGAAVPDLFAGVSLQEGDQEEGGRLRQTGSDRG